ncbi:hypothetical protein SAMN05443428_101206 [Caloramator quimbayensis]|uniref:Uncharacterized protein n=1 Tax=Caloramator quimbayensis TaxID=1147123 RepID=A0A1T4WH62_9CLOT|nr:hypothetical protein [Caloramator quimbayensis]SKA76509.1 hypothetical protein SAMN05443428_101206 [Caloramator quimbayensis]
MSNITIKNSNLSLKSLNDLYTQAVLNLIKSNFYANADEIDYLIEVIKKAIKQEECS